MIKAEYIQHMGIDLTVANAARVSFKKKKDTFDDKDARLIKFLARNNHWTPFGHCSATFHIECPVFVRAQLAKHTVGLVMNEVSRRYVDDAPDFWLPKEWRKRAENKKQGSSDETLADGDDYAVTNKFDEVMTHCTRVYQYMIDHGVAPEQARAVLPQAMYTEFYWTGSLAAWARVCKLRLDEHAQAETREVAESISSKMGELFPVSWEALMNNEKQTVRTGS